MHDTSSIGALHRRLKPVCGRMCVVFISVLLSACLPSFASSLQEGDGPSISAASASDIVSPEPRAAEEHLSPKATELFSVGSIPVTNSMVTGWLAMFLLAAVAIRFRQQVRAGRHTLLTGTIEALVTFLHGFLSEIMGARLASKTFWLLGSFFIFILIANWLGLFPGIGSIGWGHETENMFRVTQPLFRGVNADLNTTLALGALFFLFWIIWAWKEKGPVGMLKHIFGVQGDMKGIMYAVMAVVFLAAGFLEIISILIRPFSMALRLYGNIFAGEVMLETMLHRVPALGWLLPIPFYMMEVLVGLVQALVFTLLSAVFTMLICGHDSTEEHSAEWSADTASQER
jgi:F-type H+-transporting ATPase subunit a